MTTEETELTFVRCPNCRSLIPAIATRCRMCGTQFEKKADAEESPPADAFDAQRKSRVRQRTISASASEVEDIKRQATNEASAPPPSSERSQQPFRLGGGDSQSRTSRNAQAGASQEDESSLETTIRSRNSERFTFSEPDEQVEAASLETSDFSEDVYPTETEDDSATATHLADQVPESEEEWSDEPDSSSEEEGNFEEEHDDDASNFEEGDQFEHEQRPEGRKKRRRRRKKRQGTQHGEHQLGEGGENLHMAAHNDQARGAREEIASNREAPRFEHARHEHSRQEVGRSDSGRSERPEVSRSEPQRISEAPRSAAPRFESAPSTDRGDGGAAILTSRGEGALIGWLVQYGSDPKGVATELRAGKFFVGRQKLRPMDLVIADSSISTPHCMVTLGGQEGFSVQDLMSEMGTHLRRANGDGTYVQIQNVVHVEHGDWLKFGEHEVLVCLLPQSNRGRR